MIHKIVNSFWFILLLVVVASVSFWLGNFEEKVDSGISITELGQALASCKADARFTIGDEGVTKHLWWNGELHRAWMRCDHVYCYYQSSDGQWGIVPAGPRFPWLKISEDD